MTITKALTNPLSVLLELKIVEGHDQKKFLVPPLSNSFRLHCVHVPIL